MSWWKKTSSNIVFVKFFQCDHGSFHTWKFVSRSELRFVFLLHSIHAVQLDLLSHCNYASELKISTWPLLRGLRLTTQTHGVCSYHWFKPVGSLLSSEHEWTGDTSPVLSYPLSLILSKKIFFSTCCRLTIFQLRTSILMCSCCSFFRCCNFL